MTTNGSINVTDPPFYAPIGGRSGYGPDATAAIQAAIDFAIANQIGTVIVPAGANFRILSPLFVDDPRNLRTSKTNPPFTCSFSLALVGAEGPALGQGAANIWADFNNDVVVWVGPGRGMTMRGITISGPPAGPSGFRNGLPASGVGIGLAAYGSGALIENCSVNLLSRGVKTGANGVDQLCDATTIRKCSFTGAVGVEFACTNNLINSVEDCVVDALVGVKAASWNGAHVRGGNFSTNLSGNSFPITGLAVQTVQQGGAQTAYQIAITATLGSPDALFLAGAYNAFAMVTQHYGVLPMEMTSYNPATGVASFVVLDAYAGTHFAGWGNDPATKTNLVAELQAAPKIYAAERATTFAGMEIHVDGVHIENGATPTTVIDGYFGTAGEGGAHNTLRNIRVNGDLTNSYLGPSVIASTATEAHKAQYYVARSFPQIKVGFTETTIDNFSMDATDERLIVDFFNPSAKLTWRGAGPKLQLRTPISGYPFGTAPATPSGTVYAVGSIPAFGAGDFDANPFYATTVMSDADTWRCPWGKGRVPMQGIRPAPWTTPGITAAQLALLSSVMLPAINLSGAAPQIGYPLLWGGQVYRLTDWFLGAQPNYHIVSAHHFYSYGQPLPISWSHVGQSPFLYVSDTRLMFPGLGVQIDHGDGPKLYLVTGVWPQMGMVSVLKAAESDNGPWLLSGDKASLYTGTSIGQEAYAITRF